MKKKIKTYSIPVLKTQEEKLERAEKRPKEAIKGNVNKGNEAKMKKK